MRRAKRTDVGRHVGGLFFLGAVGQHMHAPPGDRLRADGDHVGGLDHRRDLFDDLAQELGPLPVVVPIFLVEADDDPFFHLGKHRDEVALVRLERAVDDEQHQVGVLGGDGRLGRPRLSAHLRKARRIHEHDRIAGRPGNLAARNGGAAHHARAKHVATRERVQQRRLAARNRAKRDDLEPLRLALGFEVGDCGFDLAAQLRRDPVADRVLLAGSQVVAQLARAFAGRHFAGAEVAALHLGRFLPRVLPDAGQDANRQAEQHQRTSSDHGEIRIAGPSAELGGRLVVFEHLGRQREQQVADHGEREDDEQTIGMTRNGHVLNYRPLPGTTPLR